MTTILICDLCGEKGDSSNHLAAGFSFSDSNSPSIAVDIEDGKHMHIECAVRELARHAGLTIKERKKR